MRENVAHSWPEVYFPGFGWERFEPTAASYTNLPARPLTAAASADAAAATPPADAGTPPPADDAALDAGLTPQPAPTVPQPTNQPNQGAGRPLALVSSVLGLVVLVVGMVYGRWRYELWGLSEAGAAYAGMALLAKWGRLPQAAHRTPSEYAVALGAALPEHRATINQIVGAYIHECYGRPTAAARHALPSATAGRELRRALVRGLVTGLTQKDSA